MYRILSATSLLHSNFFQSLLVDGKSISSQLYFSIKGLILDTLCENQDLVLMLRHIENIYHHYF